MFALPVVQLLAQTKTITGKVTDEKGNGIPNASVSIKGTKKGAIANESGNFTITASEGDVLVISATGFSSGSIKITTQDFYAVILKDDLQSMEVATALGIKKKKNELPYATQRLDGKDISQARTSNFVNNLGGKIAGLEIKRGNNLGASTNVILRGNKSLTGNNQVLFVIDGVPVDNTNTNTINNTKANKNVQISGGGGYDYGNAVADINPDDIESMNVLKGSAATALYGSRASNGVIVITTKKGTKGLGITFNMGASIGLVDPSTFPKYQKEYGGGYGALYESPDGYFLYRDAAAGFKLQPRPSTGPDLVVPFSEDASFGAKFNPNLLVYDWTAFDPSSPNYHKPRPWTAGKNDPSSFLENALSTNYSIMLDGGGDKGNFKLGYTNTTDKGILPNSKIIKNLINFGSSYKIDENLTASGSINFSKIDGIGRYATGYDGTTASSKNVFGSFRQWWQMNVDVKELKDAYNRTGKNVTWNWSDPTKLSPAFWNNPYWSRYENFETDSRSRYFGNVALTYKINSWIDVLARTSLDSYDEIQEERIAVTSLGVSRYSQFNRRFSEQNYDLMANINKDINPELNFKATIGTNTRITKQQSIFAETNGGLLIPKVYALLNSKNPIEAPTERITTERVDGVFASATLGYKNFLFLDLGARRDISSTLPKGNNAYFYPSSSLGFIFSKFTTDAIPWLSYGKVRINYAEVGNTAPALYVKDYYLVPTGIDGVPLATVDDIKYNPDLKPERTKSFETGIELAFLKGRISLDITYYKQNTVDQIVPLSVSASTGYGSKIVNAGNIENKGIEIALNANPIKTSNFSWNIGLNLSRNRNLVKDLGPGVKNLQLAAVQGGVSINAAVGEPYGTIRGSNFVYLNGQKVVDADGHYLKSSTANEIIGNVNPDWIGGMTNTFKYKDFSLNFLIDARKGGKVFSLDMAYGLSEGLYPETAGLNDLGKPVRDPVAQGGGIILPGVKEDGTPNTKRIDMEYGTLGITDDRNPAAAHVYDASYIKLRELVLTYSFPAFLIKNLYPIKGIDFSLVGTNLWIIYKKLPYADPEEGLSSGNVQGNQSGSVPATRNIGFNLKFKF